MSYIEDIIAREILDSRGNPTVEVEVGSRSIEGQVFGFRKRYSLRLGGWMRLFPCSAGGRWCCSIAEPAATG